MLQSVIQTKIRRTERQIVRLMDRLAEEKAHHKQIKESGGKVTEHGGWDIGYIKGRLFVLQDQLDDLKEIARLSETERGVDL